VQRAGDVLAGDRHLAGVVGRERDPHLAVDRRGQHPTVLVVGMLADHVDAPGGTDERGGALAVAVAKALLRAATGRHGCALARCR
jgi:hypothetical protein